MCPVLTPELVKASWEPGLGSPVRWLPLTFLCLGPQTRTAGPARKGAVAVRFVLALTPPSPCSRCPKEEEQVGLGHPSDDDSPAHHPHHHGHPARRRHGDHQCQWLQDHGHLRRGHHREKGQAVTRGPSLGWLGHSPRGAAAPGPEETVQPGDRCRRPGAALLTSGLGSAPRCHPPRSLCAAAQPGRGHWHRGGGRCGQCPHTTRSPGPSQKRHILTSRASSVVSFEAEVEVPSALSSSSCWGGDLRVGGRAAEARGTSPWGWPRKLPWSFPASASRRGQAGVQRVGGVGGLFPLCAALILKPGRFSDKSRGLRGGD